MQIFNSLKLHYQEARDFISNIPKCLATSVNSRISQVSAHINTQVTHSTPAPIPKVVIIGSGPAGYTAAIYAARANLPTVVYEGAFTANSIPGGQLMTTSIVENYPGFPTGIEGMDLMANLRQQALNYGAEMLEENVVDLDLTKRPFKVIGQKTNHVASAIIIATGATANRSDIPGTREGELWQKGVSACARCDGALPLFRNRPVHVIGGGDSAMEEALFLSKFASKVFIVSRKDTLRASKIMQERVFANPKIDIVWNSTITQVCGNNKVEYVMITNEKSLRETQMESSGVFFAIGHTPNTTFLKGQIALDSSGYIAVKPGTTQTNVPYVFAAGDVQDPVYRQAITAAGSGCMAALDVEKALNFIQVR